MKKIIFTLATLALMLTGCNNFDEPEVPQKVRTMTFSATMPDDAQTRAFYELNDAILYPGLKMKWEEGDNLYVDIVYNEQHLVAVAPAKNIDGNKADFTITLPEGTIPEGETFDVYAAYQKGGSGINKGNFIANPNTGYYALSGDNGICPLVYGSQKGVTTVGAFSLKHAGWVMAFRLKNATDSDLSISMVAYQATENTNFVYELNNTQLFNLLEGKPTGTPNTKVFYAEDTKDGLCIPANSTKTFYRWIVSDSSIPAGSFRIQIIGDKLPKWSSEFPGATVENGKVYYTDLTWDGTNLSLSEYVEVGMVIGSDGKFYTNKAAAEAAGKEARAMVAFLGKVEGVCENGLAIALEDASTAELWADAKSKLDTWKGNHEVPGCTWRMPSAYDWQRMLIGCGSESTYTEALTDGKSFDCGNLRTMLKEAAGDEADVKTYYNYWSDTTDIETGQAWGYHFSESRFLLYNKTLYVLGARACLAF